MTQDIYQAHCHDAGCSLCGSSAVSPQHVRLLPVTSGAVLGAVLGSYVTALLNITSHLLSDLLTVLGIVVGIAVAVILIRTAAVIRGALFRNMTILFRK
ncbi:MAG: hypothetical protein CMQ05_03215 [Gammaproteobacteria bacterium]|nr:hypothetical protein [Gammaproteobacteria bacterium]